MWTRPPDLQGFNLPFTTSDQGKSPSKRNMSTCKTCDQPLPPQIGKGRPFEYCNPSCYESRYQSDRPTGLTCQVCDKPFTAGKRGPAGRFCSTPCRKRHYNPPVSPPRPRDCVRCGKQFVPTRNDLRSVCCSQTCFASHRNRKRLGDPYSVECAFCGEPFLLDPLARSQQLRKYCSSVCRSQSGRDGRRARLAGVEVERINRFLVFERDEYVCGICHEPVDRVVKHPDPGCASLDHIIPIAKGGSHTYGNVQCAHLGCNLVKSTKIPT